MGGIRLVSMESPDIQTLAFNLLSEQWDKVKSAPRTVHVLH